MWELLRGQKCIWPKMPPTLLGPSVGLCGASVNFTFHALRSVGRTGGAPWGRGEGDFHLMYSWSLKSGHFKQKSPLSKSPKIMILIIYVSLLAQS